MQLLNRLSIRAKLYAGFGVVVAALVAVDRHCILGASHSSGAPRTRGGQCGYAEGQQRRKHAGRHRRLPLLADPVPRARPLPCAPYYLGDVDTSQEGVRGRCLPSPPTPADRAAHPPRWDASLLELSWPSIPACGRPSRSGAPGRLRRRWIVPSNDACGRTDRGRRGHIRLWWRGSSQAAAISAFGASRSTSQTALGRSSPRSPCCSRSRSHGRSPAASRAASHPCASVLRACATTA